MCWSKGCLDQPSNVHGDHRTITTSSLQDAADAAGTDIPGVVANLVRVLAATNFTATKGSALSTEYAACLVVKAQEERRYTLGLAYPAMRLDRGVAADGHIDFVSQGQLEKTAWEWMTNHREISLFHKEATSGHATVVESYIWRAGPWAITSPVDGAEYVIKEGDWMLGTVWDQHGWDLVKSGKVRGWSPEGAAKRSRPSASRLAELRS